MYVLYMYTVHMNNHVHRTPFLDIERKKEVAKSKERRKKIHNFINSQIVHMPMHHAMPLHSQRVLSIHYIMTVCM